MCYFFHLHFATHALMFMHSAHLGYFHRNTNRDTFITTLKANSCPLSVIHKQLMKILSNTNLSELANYSDVITKFRMLPAVYKHMVSPQLPQDLKLSYLLSSSESKAFLSSRFL